MLNLPETNQDPAALLKMVFLRWKTSTHEGQSQTLNNTALSRTVGTLCIQLKWHISTVNGSEYIQSTMCEGGQHRVSLNSSASSQVDYVRLNSVLGWMPLNLKKQKNVFLRAFRKIKKACKTFIFF